MELSGSAFGELRLCSLLALCPRALFVCGFAEESLSSSIMVVVVCGVAEGVGAPVFAYSISVFC